MKERQRRIVEWLATYEWITGKDLARLLGVSDRTIRNDIVRLKEQEGLEILSDRKKGYALSGKTGMTANELASREGRRHRLLHSLLTQSAELSVDVLCQQLYISSSTLHEEVQALQKRLEKYGLQLSIVRGIVFLQGSEHDKRMLYKDLLIQETRGDFLQLKTMAESYQAFDLLEAKDFFEEQLRTFGWRINAVDFPLLIIYIGVALDRICKGHVLAGSETADSEIESTEEYRFAKQYFDRLSTWLDRPIEVSEVCFFAQLLSRMCRHQPIRSPHLLFETPIRSLLRYLSDNMEIHLQGDQALIERLDLHFQNLAWDTASLFRDNPWVSEIKQNAPFIFELAVISGDYLKRTFGFHFTEEQLGFLALHLGVAYETCYAKMCRAMLILPTASLENSVGQRIARDFEGRLELVPYEPGYDLLRRTKPHVDFIISAIPIPQASCPVVSISPFYRESDEFRIFQMVNEWQEETLRNTYAKDLERLLTERHFYKNPSVRTREALLDLLCRSLLREGAVEAAYRESVGEREAISDTAFSIGFATPHALHADLVRRSTIAVALFDEPIPWGRQTVRLVFLLAIRRCEISTLHLFFQHVDALVQDLPLFASLLEATDCSDFLKRLRGEEA